MIIEANTDSLSIADAWDRTPISEIESLSKYPVSLIADAHHRLNVMSSSIQLVTPRRHLAGNVLPITSREGDNLAIHRALDDARPGDVLVVNSMGDTNRACFGGILGELCIQRKIAGVVIDGATRDVSELQSQGLPVFARGISPAGPFKYGPGRIGFPVACGNVVCQPGDAIFGDADGVVVIPRSQLEEALDRVKAQQVVEESILERIG
ncbi:RraA family protein [Nesterenkonia muleiensis]|uniref:RraA family protein n=1 Tax=Nesterenkonia muleiensis TaxID=2282648 RepID=UPI000E746464|nr:RraA family protein [Nesterenkonia muleiensis]